MKFVANFFVYTFLSFLLFVTFTSISNGLIQEQLFLETNIKYRGSPGVLTTHRRLGLAGKKEIHVDSNLESAKFLGYNAFKPRLKEFSYEIHTFADKENKFSLDYRIKTDNLGFVTQIESRA